MNAVDLKAAAAATHTAKNWPAASVPEAARTKRAAPGAATTLRNPIKIGFGCRCWEHSSSLPSTLLELVIEAADPRSIETGGSPKAVTFTIRASYTKWEQCS